MNSTSNGVTTSITAEILEKTVAPQLWTEIEIAAIFRVERITVIRKLSSDPASLPPSLKIGRRHVWIPSKVIDWIAHKTDDQEKKIRASSPSSITTNPLLDGVKRGRGRPRKVALFAQKAEV